MDDERWAIKMHDEHECYNILTDDDARTRWLATSQVCSSYLPTELSCTPRDYTTNNDECGEYNDDGCNEHAWCRWWLWWCDDGPQSRCLLKCLYSSLCFRDLRSLALTTSGCRPASKRCNISYKLDGSWHTRNQARDAAWVRMENLATSGVYKHLQQRIV